MKCEIKRMIDTTAMVTVAGRLDANSAGALKTLLKKAINEGLTHLIIDMERVTFIDSSGLSSLISSFKTARQHNGTVALARVPPQAKMVLELTRLDKVFPVYENVDMALNDR